MRPDPETTLRKRCSAGNRRRPDVRADLPATLAGVPYAVRSGAIRQRTPAAPQQPGSTLAPRCGTWLFRHRNATLSPLALGVAASAWHASMAQTVPTAVEDVLRCVALGLLVVAATIRLHVAGRAKRGTSSRGVTFEAGDLVTDGMYAISRNPLYLANLMIWGGMALLAGSPAVAAAIVAVAGSQYHLIVLAEEQYLGDRYAQRYEQYRRCVPRWIPQIVFRSRRRVGDGQASPFTWHRALFREADTLLLLILGAWFLFGLGREWMPWDCPTWVPPGWHLLLIGPTAVWLVIKGLKKSRWKRG
jgi:protein-S-isoprenylcysteine O-methyltransferase Ste14